MNDPRTETNGLYFKLKDQNTGNDILVYSGTGQLAPDSIKMRNIQTGIFYSLFIGQTANASILFSNQYRRPAGVVDSLEFRFGNSVPDTLIVFTGVVKGWRGDECPYIDDAGIIKVMLNGQALVETIYNDAMFTLFK